MALYGAFSRHKHFDELDDSYFGPSGVLTPAQRRALCLANLFQSSPTVNLGVTGSFTATTLVGSTSLTTPKLLTATNVGTAGTNVVAEEHMDGVFHVTKLTCTAFAVGTGADAADLGIGAVVYTLPAGAVAVMGGAVEGIFDQTSHGVITAGEVGLGTVVASGAVAVLSGTATFEDCMNGVAIATYTLGTTRVTAAAGPTAPEFKAIATGASPRTVFLNLAASWPNIASAEAVTFTGTVTIMWMMIA